MMNKQVNKLPGIIAVDLDGTLFAADHKSITPRTYDVLRRCIAGGSHLVPTTGRCESIIPMGTFPAARYVISCNGGFITDTVDGKILRAMYLPRDSVRKAWELVRERVIRYELVMEFFEERDIVVERKILDGIDRYESKIPVFHRPVIIGGKAKYVESFDKYLEEEGDRIVKINFPGKNVEQCPEIRDELLEMGLFEITSDGLNLEATFRGCNKGEALLWLSDYLGVAQSDTVAFGDGNNDLSMIHAAGYGVAMGNALDEVKKAARHSTTSNTEDGIAVFLENTFSIESN